MICNMHVFFPFYVVGCSCSQISLFWFLIRPGNGHTPVVSIPCAQVHTRSYFQHSGLVSTHKRICVCVCVHASPVSNPPGQQVWPLEQPSHLDLVCLVFGEHVDLAIASFHVFRLWSQLNAVTSRQSRLLTVSQPQNYIEGRSRNVCFHGINDRTKNIAKILKVTY